MMQPTPQQIRKQRLRLALITIFFAFLGCAIGSVAFAMIMWRAVDGR